MKKIAFLVGAVALALTSCAPQYNAAAQKPVATLSCTDMKSEYKQLMNIRAEADSKSGLSKENIGLALLFWPAAAVNEIDNRDVKQKVDARTAEIVKASIARGCPVN